MSAPLSTWQAVRTVAGRELRERLRDRSFWMSTLITFLILGAVLFMPRVFGDNGRFSVAFAGPNADAVASTAEAQAKHLNLTIERADYSTEEAARDALKAGELDAYVTDNAIVVRDELDDQLGLVLNNAHREVASAEQLRQAGLDPEAVRAAQTVAPLQVDALDPPDPAAEQRGQIAFIGSIILYGQIVGYCMWVAFGIVEEKSSRVVELILSAIPTRPLLAGKILGIGLLGLLQLIAIGAFGLALGHLSNMVTVTADLLVPIGYVLAWFVLGYTFYSSVFAASAARVSRQEELQNVIGPASTVLMLSIFGSVYVNLNPDTLAARLLGTIPPFSALCAPVRMAREAAPWWETSLALCLMLAAIAVLVVVGARIYEGAILRMGAKTSLKEAWFGARTSA